MLLVPTAAHAVDVLQPPYSAPADGVANDTPAIQAAIDDVAGTGGTVVLPAGRTYVVSTLALGDDTTLRIDGIVKQATSTAYYPYTPLRGHKVTAPPSQVDAAAINRPLILARHVDDVAITGSGTLQMMTGADSTLIHVSPIGMFDVSRYEIAGLTIADAPFWTVRLNKTNQGVLHDLTMTSAHQNSDGISVTNSQAVEVYGNDIDTADDGIYVRSNGPGYEELRARNAGYVTWYDSSDPQPTKNVEIHHNVVESNTSGFAVIPFLWGGAAPYTRLEDLEISNISVHDNAFSAPDVLRCWCNITSTADGGVTISTGRGAHSPVRDLTMLDNTLTSSSPASSWSLKSLSDVTSLTTDVPSLVAPSTGRLSWPGERAVHAGLNALLLNGDFESAARQVYWSSTGIAGVVALGTGRAGRLQGSGGAASLYQGVGLVAGTYTFSVQATTSGAGATLYAYDTCSAQTLATKSFTAARATVVTLRIPVPGACGNVAIGVRIASGAANAATFDHARLRNANATYVDSADPSLGYTGTWLTSSTQSYYHGGTIRYATVAGSRARIPWYGGRAELLGTSQPDGMTGEAHVWVDGVDKGYVSWYRPTLTHKNVIYDTGTLPLGAHVIELEMTGRAPDVPTVTRNYINVDALRVLPLP
jgi:hypothetical protein